MSDGKFNANAAGTVRTAVSGIRFQAVPTLGSRALYVGDGLVMAEIGRTCVALWKVAPDDFHFDRQKTALLDIVRSRPDPIGFLCVVEPEAPPPKESIRRATVDMLQSQKEHIACIACVIGGQGFRSAITRSVLAGMAFLLAPRDFHVKFVVSVEEAAVWMANYVKLGPVPAYCKAVEYYRSLDTSH